MGLISGRDGDSLPDVAEVRLCAAVRGWMSVVIVSPGMVAARNEIAPENKFLQRVTATLSGRYRNGKGVQPRS